ncbi:uncharacterized protein LOC101858706 [Aplysia californica]|uniref:Uncharacterized protein LOC101858706 n=1 Tax=Aplysia californica TaxID=6500 RepID=A0ABM0JLP4_APLCA|nr:uncharacterized protein LOC101858706 [Aplysia californica]
MGLEVLAYVPNIVGYIRIVLASCAFLLFQQPVWFTILYSISISLDGIDGYLARKLNQTSKFGAWFDVVIDLFSRGYLWCALFRSGYLVVMLEWLTFVCTHSRGENWRIPEENFPMLVKMVMANGFKGPLGIFAIGSLHILPLWMYGYESRMLTDVLTVPMWVQLTLIALLSVGRTICAAVELFYVKEYVSHLLHVNEK